MQLIPTSDETLTAFSELTGETYHNRCGAWLETQAIYIQPLEMTRRLQQNDALHLLDPFFGLGYITLGCIAEFAQCIEEEKLTGKSLHITAIENDTQLIPVLMDILAQFDLECLQDFKNQFAHKIYYQTQEHPPKKGARYSLALEKYPITVEFIYDDVRASVPKLETQSLDAIFHDAFSPTKQPELWTPELFTHYRRLLKDKTSLLLTYSQASHVRRALRDSGFILYKAALEVTEGYPKPGTMGALQTRPNQPGLDAFEVAIMDTRAGIPYRDSSKLDKPIQQVVADRLIEQGQYTGPSTSSIHRQFKTTTTPIK